MIRFFLIPLFCNIKIIITFQEGDLLMEFPLLCWMMLAMGTFLLNWGFICLTVQLVITTSSNLWKKYPRDIQESEFFTYKRNSIPEILYIRFVKNYSKLILFKNQWILFTHIVHFIIPDLYLDNRYNYAYHCGLMVDWCSDCNAAVNIYVIWHH